MATQRYSLGDVLGLAPAVDARVSSKIYALGGSGFIFDSLGLRSPFGNRRLAPFRLSGCEHIQGIRLKLRSGDRTFTYTTFGIIEWSEESGGWRFIYLTGDTSVQPYRWTHAYVNGVMFFCHPQTGIIAYDITEDAAGILEGPGVPTAAISICEDNGRLIAMDDIYAYWSEQSNGGNFEPSLGGPGFQKVNDRVSGFPIMVNSYTKGFLVWTTGGVMRGEFTGDAAVYRFRAINSEYRPVNSFCTVKMNQDTVVILDERGLFQSQGESPTPMAPLFNEFLIGFLQKYDLKIGQNVRLEWDDLQKRLYVSVSFSYSSPLYERCFVLYPSLDKWGIFAEAHYGIFPVTVKGSLRADDFYAFVDSDGYPRYWDDLGSREIEATRLDLDLVYPVIQKPFHRPGDEEGLVLSSSIGFQTRPETAGLVAGLYPRDGNVMAPPVLTGLAAKVQIGLLRLGDESTVGRMGEITQLIVGNIISGDKDRVKVDYNIVPPGSNEDYLIENGGEDFGLEENNYVNHGLRVIGTKDGKTSWQSQIPELVQFDTAARHYVCSVTGVWHILEITALEVGEAFHIQLVELTGVDAGSLL
jgi:hypothetical protein